MTWWLIYIWTRLNIICGASLVALVFCLLAFVCNGIEASTAQDYKDKEKERACLKYMKESLIWAGIFFLFFLVIPDKKDMAMIYVIPKMAQSEIFFELNKELPELTRVGVEALKEQLKELSGKKEVKTNE